MNRRLVWVGAAIYLLTIIGTGMGIATIMYRLIMSLGFEKGLLASLPILTPYAMMMAVLLWWLDTIHHWRKREKKNDEKNWIIQLMEWDEAIAKWYAMFASILALTLYIPGILLNDNAIRFPIGFCMGFCLAAASTSAIWCITTKANLESLIREEQVQEEVERG